MIDIAPHFGQSVLEVQRIRRRDERPRLPWDSHPGWTEHAMRHKNEAIVAPPRVWTDLDVRILMSARGTPATDLVP